LGCAQGHGPVDSTIVQGRFDSGRLTDLE
jgi:hypothetical protein